MLTSLVSHTSPEDGTDEVDTLQGTQETKSGIVQVPALLHEGTKKTVTTVDGHAEPKVQELRPN